MGGTGKVQQPYCFELNEGELFAFAGLWDGWKDPNGNWIRTCSILTTMPNAVTSAVHDRMPVILDPDSYDGRLDPGMNDVSVASGLLKPSDALLIRCYLNEGLTMKISARVSSTSSGHTVEVETDGRRQAIGIAPKTIGRGSSINGGEPSADTGCTLRYPPKRLRVYTTLVGLDRYGEQERGCQPPVKRDFMEPNILTRLKRVAGKQTTILTHYGRKTGKPHEVTIWFVLDDDKLYLGTANVNRQWVRNVQKTPKIRLSIGGETFEGNARFLADRAEHERAMAAIRQKYWMFRPLIALGRFLAAMGLMRDNTGSFEVTLAA